MCGIGGILRVHPPGSTPPPAAAIPEAWLDIIDDAIKHRGPDGKGRFRDRVVRPDGSTVDVALVHRRLSIIDHRDGWQPMVQGGAALLRREDEPYRETATHVCPRCSMLASRAPTVRERVSGSSSEIANQTHSLTVGARQSADLLAVVFNGCIYNHRELRRELQTAGHTFATDHSDTEVLLHGWREWAENLSEHLIGMYAWAAWDRARVAVALSRDQFGEKPLVSATMDRGVIAFGSGFLPVLAIEHSLCGKHAVNRRVLNNWIRKGFGDTAPTHGWQEPRGTIRVLDPFGEARRSVSRTPADEDPSPPEASDLEAQIENLLRSAVSQRLEADVPIGCFLSGGIDSSLIALMARQAHSPLQTFCVRMPDPRIDESAIAARVAEQIGTLHTTLDCTTKPAEDLPWLIQQMGVPFGDSSLLPTYWVSRAAREHVTVAIAGDGGDELFAGYNRHRAMAVSKAVLYLTQFVPSFLLSEADARSRSSMLARLARAARLNDVYELLAIFQWHQLRVLLPGVSRGDLEGGAFRWHPEDDCPTGLDEMLCVDRWDYLPNDLLRKTDIASMAVGLEVRCPMLDPSLARFVFSLPARTLLPRGQRKGLLRAVARKYFPPEIVDRPKQGFAIPIGDWFRSDYGGMKQLLLDHLNSAEPWGSPSLGIDLNMKFVRQMLDEHMNLKRDHSQRLYMLLVLSIWAKGLGRA